MPRKRKTDTTGADHAQDTKAKRGPGQPRKIQNAEALARVVDDYIIYNQEANEQDIVPPTDYDFCKFAGIGSSTLDDYIRETDTYEGYSAVLKKLFQYREQYFLAAGMKNPKLAGVTNFALKQRKNGGYEDKPSVNIEARELKIVHGNGMTDDSFK